jgi:hypothetical protein
LHLKTIGNYLKLHPTIILENSICKTTRKVFSKIAIFENVSSCQATIDRHLWLQTNSATQRWRKSNTATTSSASRHFLKTPSSHQLVMRVISLLHALTRRNIICSICYLFSCLLLELTRDHSKISDCTWTSERVAEYADLLILDSRWYVSYQQTMNNNAS